MKTETWSRLTNYLMFAVCSVGLLYQVIEISILYFTYTTTDNEDLVAPGFTPNPALSLCFRYGDIINYDMLNEKYPEANISYSEQKAVDYIGLYPLVTIKDLFEMTPNIPDILLACKLRQSSGIFIDSYEGEEICSKIFAVTKYYTMVFICYFFNYTQEYSGRNTTFSILASSPVDQGMIFQVKLNLTSFKRADVIRPIVHGVTYYPLNSMGVTPDTRRVYNEEEGKAKTDSFSVDYYSGYMKRLPPPYPTMCEDYSKRGFLLQRDCIDACVSAITLKIWSKVSFTSFVTKSLDAGHLSETELDEAGETIFIQDIKKCRKSCSALSCIDGMTITSSDGIESSPDKKIEEPGLEFKVNIPRRMGHSTEVLPAMDLTAYFVYISSCLGLWYGVSCLILDPEPLIMLIATYFMGKEAVTKRTASKTRISSAKSKVVADNVRQESLREMRRRRRRILILGDGSYCYCYQGKCNKHRINVSVSSVDVSRNLRKTGMTHDHLRQN